MKMPSMDSSRWSVLLAAGAVWCAASGCWEEVRYEASEPQVATRPDPAPQDEPVATAGAEDPADTTPATTDTADDRVDGDEAPGDFAAAGNRPAERTARDAAVADGADTDRFASAAPNPATADDDFDPLPWEVDDTPAEAGDQAAEDDAPSDPLFGGLVEPTGEQSQDTAAANHATETSEPSSPSAEPATTLPALPANEPRQNTPRIAWLLGSKLSLAALARDRGAPADEVTAWFEQSQTLARLLGASVHELPSSPPEASGASPGPALDYLFAEGRTLGRQLARQQGDELAALFELAVKSNVLLALYRPDEPIVAALGGAIRQAGQRAALPSDLWQPLLDQLARGAPPPDVRKAVFRLHEEVDRYLTSPETK